MPALTDVGSSMVVSNNDRLESFSAPILDSLGSNLTIRDNPDLTDVDLSSLTCISDFTIEGNDLTEESHYDLLVALTCSSEDSLIVFRDTDAADFCAGGATEVDKTKKEERKKHGKKVLPDGNIALERESLGTRAYEMYRSRMSKVYDPDGLDDDFASNAPPHGLR